MFIKINLKYFIIAFVLLMLYAFSNSIFGQTASITGFSPGSGTQTAPASGTMYYSVSGGGLIEVTLNGSVVESFYGGGGSYSYGFSSLSAGTHRFGAHVNGSSYYNNYVVNSPPPPSVSIYNVSPSSGSQYETASATIYYNISQSCVVSFYKNGVNVSTTGNNAGNYTYTFSGLSAGTHTLEVAISNSNGSDSDAQNYNVLARVPPTASISSISPNPVLSGNSVSFSGSGNDPDGGAIQAYSWRSSRDGQLSSSSSFSTSSLSVGTHTIYFKVQDNEGEWSSEVSSSVTVTLPPPTVSINGFNIPSGTGSEPLNVTMYYQLGEGGGTVSFYLDGAYQSTTGNGEGVFTYTYSSLSQGSHTLRVDVSNSYGSDSDSENYVVNPPPAPTVSITNFSPPSNTVEVPVSPTMYYTTDQFTEVEIKLDGSTLATPSKSAGSHSYTLPSLSAGTHTMVVNVSNANGSGSDSQNYVVINSVPQATINASSPVNVYLGESITITGSGSDLDGGSIAGYNWRSNISGNISTTNSFNTSQLGIGAHTVYFKVLDDEGEWSPEESITVRVYYQISGYVKTMQNEPIEGVSLSIQPYGSTVTEANGFYSFDDAVENTTFNLTPSKTGYRFLPQTGSVINISANSTFNFTAIPIPVAEIVSITPNPAGQTQTINFSGTGSTELGTITEYKWWSNSTSNLSDQQNFSMSGFTPGTHTIYFKVKNSYGEWSAQVSEELVINQPPAVTFYTMLPASPVKVYAEPVLTFNSSQTGAGKIFMNDSLVFNGSVNIAGVNTFNFDKIKKAGTYLIKIEVTNVNGSGTDSTVYVVERDVKSISYNYDNLNNIKEINIDDDFKFKYSYNAESLLETVSTDGPNSVESIDADYTYNKAGQVTNLQLAVGGVGNITYGYDVQRGWLKSVVHSVGKFSENLNYLNNGNISEQTISNPTLGVDYTYTFGYDNMNRLISASSTISGNSETYSYNLDGRIESKNRTGNDLSYKYWNGNNRLQRLIKNSVDTSHYAFDVKGNLYGGYGVLKEYNHRNQPTEMMNEDSVVYNYVYNSQGERVRKENIDDGSGDYYLRDFAGRELVIYDNETGDVKSANIYGNGLIGKINVDGITDTRNYYLKDHLGSIRTILNTSGTVVSAIDYYPYGETLRSFNDNRYMFTEKERDSESGYDNFGWRTFDPNGAFWLQVDPMAHLRPGLSPYNYVQNNPMNRTDPTGMVDEGGEDDDDETTWLEDLVSLFSIDSKSSNSTSNESVGSEPVVNAVKKVDETIKSGTQKTKEATVSVFAQVDEASSNVAGGAAVLTLATSGTPAQPFFAAVSTGASAVSLVASSGKYLLTGSTSDRNNLLFSAGSFVTGNIGKGALKSAYKAPDQNLLYNVYEGTINAISFGTGLILK